MTSWNTVEELTAAREEIEGALEGFVPPVAFGVGVATVAADGTVLDTWYPHVSGVRPTVATAILARSTGYTDTTGTFPLSTDQLDSLISDLEPAEACTDVPHPNIASWRAVRGLLDGELSGGRTRSAVATFVASHDDGPVDTVADQLAVGDPRGGGCRLGLGVERAERALHRTTRPRDLVLVHEERTRVELPDSLSDQLPLVPDHNGHVHGLELTSCSQRVPDHRLAAERMQDLR